MLRVLLISVLFEFYYGDPQLKNTVVQKIHLFNIIKIHGAGRLQTYSKNNGAVHKVNAD